MYTFLSCNYGKVSFDDSLQVADKTIATAVPACSSASVGVGLQVELQKEPAGVYHHQTLTTLSLVERRQTRLLTVGCYFLESVDRQESQSLQYHSQEGLVVDQRLWMVSTSSHS